MKPKIYQLLDECVSIGIERGIRRAHKHNDAPDQQRLSDCIHVAVMGEINEWFDFDMTTYEGQP